MNGHSLVGFGPDWGWYLPKPGISGLEAWMKNQEKLVMTCWAALGLRRHVVSSLTLNGHRKRVLRAGFRAHNQSSCTGP